DITDYSVETLIYVAGPFTFLYRPEAFGKTKTLGKELLREVCSYLNAAESVAYFGIRYVDNNSLPAIEVAPETDSSKTQLDDNWPQKDLCNAQWLDPERRVMKQIKGGETSRDIPSA
ncbi:hypothetical protein X801_05937, partial [Opisthorchis viverrini]